MRNISPLHACTAEEGYVAIVDIWLSKRIDVQLAESLILDNQSNIKRENLHAQIMYEQE